MSQARQGEVYRAILSPRIGFRTDAQAADQLVVVVQGDALNSALETVLVLPLRSARDGASPIDVVVPAAELTTSSDHVTMVHLMRPLALSSLAPGHVARLSRPTLARVLAAVHRAFH